MKREKSRGLLTSAEARSPETSLRIAWGRPPVSRAYQRETGGLGGALIHRGEVRPVFQSATNPACEPDPTRLLMSLSSGEPQARSAQTVRSGCRKGHRRGFASHQCP